MRSHFCITNTQILMDFPFSNSTRHPSSYIPLHRTQLHPRMHSLFSSSSSYGSSSSSSSSSAYTLRNSKKTYKPKCLILLASLLTFSLVFYLFTTGQKIHTSTNFSQPRSNFFAVVIHASLYSSKINVFEFLAEGRVPFLQGSGSVSMKVTPGLMGFEDDPRAAGRSILKLVEFAKQRVPNKQWAATKVYLVATQELEKLSVEVRDNILGSCRNVLRSSGFLFEDEWARSIRALEQGVASWVAVNYVLGNLGREPQETAAIVEFGGASLQLIMALDKAMPSSSSQTIKFSGITYKLYAQNLPQFGQDSAWESLNGLVSSMDLTSSSRSNGRNASNPCIPRGYVPTSNESKVQLPMSYPDGNFSACRSVAATLLKKKQADSCLQASCRFVSSFLEVQGRKTADPDVFYTSEYFGIVPTASLFELEKAGQHYCEDDWETLKAKHGDINDLDLIKHCFSSAYIMALLHDTLQLPAERKRIELENDSRSFPIDWTLGSFIMETMQEPVELEATNVDGVNAGGSSGGGSLTYFSLFAVVLVVMLAAFCAMQWRKPQVQTIYDLEKGRYIVRHVPR